MSKINKIPDFLAMTKAMQREVRIEAETIGVNHFQDSFYKQGFTDVAFEPWQPSSYSEKALINTGTLLDSIQVMQSSKRRIIFGSDKEYAEYHNDGYPITKKMRGWFWYMYKDTGEEKYKFMALTKQKRIPKRQFIGHSWYLLKKIEDEMFKIIDRKTKKL